jgi:MtN3 and saliva related transmembrane protein
MQAVDVFGMAAASFGVVMASAPLLQARTIWLRRSADDVSQSFLAIIAFGAVLWALYGFADRNWFIFVPNVVAVVTNLLTLHLARRFAGPPLGETERPPANRPRTPLSDTQA